MDKNEEAEFHFKEALKINPSSSKALSKLAEIEMVKDNLFEAIELFVRANHIDP